MQAGCIMPRGEIKCDKIIVILHLVITLKMCLNYEFSSFHLQVILF